MYRLEYCPSGIPGFDEVTGGFYRGQVILVAGNAGSGKTTFSAKFIYEGARKFNEPGIYISTGESKREFYSYMHDLGMNFEEIEKMNLFRFIEMFSPTSNDALMILSEKLTANALEIKAKRIVIDSISPFLKLTQAMEARAILQNALRSLAKTLDSTILLTVEIPTGETRIGAEIEEFVVDGVIKLRLEVGEAGSPRRIMEVLKLRGRSMGRVAYEYEIGSPYGIRVLQSVGFEEYESFINREDRLSTGIERLDKLLGDGLIKGSSTLILGPSGSGKTLLILTIIAENVLKGEKALFITFEEPKQQIFETLKFLNYNINELKDLKIISINPRAISLTKIYDLISNFIINNAGAILALDGINALIREFGNIFLKTLRDVLVIAKKHKVTVLMSMLRETVRDVVTYVSTLADNIIRLRIREIDGKLIREFTVVKARMSSVDSTFHNIELINGKLVIK